MRFIQVNYSDNSNNPAWDQHNDMCPSTKEHALAVDKPIAGLLTDLKQRGLLEDTLVWWGGEFGRTPYAQKNGDGRDHNPTGFNRLAGWRRGKTRTQFTAKPTSSVKTRWRTKSTCTTSTPRFCHLLGLDHERLTFRHEGRDFRLTDVFGNCRPRYHCLARMVGWLVWICSRQAAKIAKIRGQFLWPKAHNS